MRLKFWARIRAEQQTDMTDVDAALTRARARLDRAVTRHDISQELSRRAERTRAINHWSPMVEEAWARRK